MDAVVVEAQEEGLEEQPQVLDITWPGSRASVTVPHPTVSTPSSSILHLPTPTATSSLYSASPPLSSLSQPSQTRTSAKCELFPTDDEVQHLTKKRKLDIELAEVNVEVGKAQLDLFKAQAALCKAQAVKIDLEKRALELECEYKALLIKQQRASIDSNNHDSFM